MAWKVAIGQVCPLHNQKVRKSNDDDQSSSHRPSALCLCEKSTTRLIIIIIIIIIISIFKEDNVFSITASLPYGPPVNTDIDYYRTFFSDLFILFYFGKCCDVNCAIFC